MRVKYAITLSFFIMWQLYAQLLGDKGVRKGGGWG